MSAPTIDVHDIRVNWLKGNSELKRRVKTEIRDIIASYFNRDDVQEIDVYNMEGIMKRFKAGSQNRLIIFANCSTGSLHDENFHKRTTEHINLGATLSISGIDLPIVTLLKQKEEQEIKVLLESDCGHPVAVYNEETNEIYILFNFFGIIQDDGTGKNEALAVLSLILSNFHDAYIKAKRERHSWKKEENRESLKQTFIQEVKHVIQRNQRDYLRQYEECEIAINDYTRGIKERIERKNRLGRMLQADKEHYNSVTDKIINELSMLVENTAIKDVELKDGKIIVYTTQINVQVIDDVYALGEYTIHINPFNTDITFISNNPRRSHWSNRDPHPHIDGRSGQPCWGNVATSVAELHGEHEIYALVMLCIGYLQSVNLDDPAGRRVVNWDRIVIDGKEVPEGKVRPASKDGVFYEGGKRYINGDSVEEQPVEEDSDDDEEEDEW